MLSNTYLDDIRTLVRDCLRIDNVSSTVTLAEEVGPRELGRVACAKSVEWQEATAYKRRGALLALGELLLEDGGVQALADQVEQYWQRFPAERDRFLRGMRRAAADDVRDMMAAAREVTEPHLKRRVSRRKEKEQQRLAAGIAPDALEIDPHNAQLWLSEGSDWATVEANEEVPKPEFESVTAIDLRRLKDTLRCGGSPLDLVLPRQPGKVRHRSGYAGHEIQVIASLLAEGSWAVGLRPGEWFQSTARIDTPGLPEFNELLVADLKRSPPPPPVQRHKWREDVGERIDRILVENTAWVYVLSLKSGWNRRHGIAIDRSVCISGLPVSMQRNICLLLIALRRTGENQRGGLIQAANLRISNAASRCLPKRSGNLSIQRMRHDFCDRCKAVLPAIEVAALMGHSSLQTQAKYGRRRGSGTLGPEVREEIRVKPHPVHLERLKTHIEQTNMKRRSGPAAEPDRAEPDTARPLAMKLEDFNPAPRGPAPPTG